MGFIVRDLAVLSHLIQRGQHECERAIGAAISMAQPGDRLGIGRIDQQLKSAEALHGHHAAGQQSLDGPGQGRFAGGRFAALGVEQLQRRTATRTGDRLGVKTRSAGLSYSA